MELENRSAKSQHQIHDELSRSFNSFLEINGIEGKYDFTMVGDDIIEIHAINTSAVIFSLTVGTHQVDLRPHVEIKNLEVELKRFLTKLNISRNLLH